MRLRVTKRAYGGTIYELVSDKKKHKRKSKR
jgi:hypothetical protein